MKKIISLSLALMLVLGILIVPASAEETTLCKIGVLSMLNIDESKMKDRKILEICSAIAGIPGIRNAEKNEDMRLFTCSAEKELSAASLQELIRRLTELNEARWEAEGRLKAEGRYITARFPDDGELTSFYVINISG